MKIFAALLFILGVSMSPALAASKLFISEYGAVPATNAGGLLQIASEPSLIEQVVDFSAGAASSAAFGAATKYIRLLCDTRCAIKISTAGTAATITNKPLRVDTVEYYGVQPGDKVSVIASP